MSVVRHLVVTALIGVAVAAGCAARGQVQPAALAIAAESSSVSVGEEVLLRVRTEGADAGRGQVLWKSDRAELSPLEGGRVCRVRFTEPGLHVVTARWLRGAEQTAEGSVSIEVRPAHSSRG